MGERKPLLEWRPAELAEYLVESGEPEFRAEQVFRWIFARSVTDFAAMTNLPKSLRQQLGEKFTVRTGREIKRYQAADGTLKILLGWPDGVATECVMIPAEGRRVRRTVCLSTQVGCDVGCRFCASGIGGAARNLKVGEVLEQALTVQSILLAKRERLTHVVFMGMGEPLANYRVTVEAVRRLNAVWSFEIAQRRMTVSTVGLPKQIERLADEGLYCLLAGVNDSPEDGQELARIAHLLRGHVNLLMYNPVASLPFERPTRETAHRFLAALRERGVKAHLRESRGLDADAACGQLRLRHRGAAEAGTP
jgi:23S rRNA (adenine2503-C2)-methyltransferase